MDIDAFFEKYLNLAYNFLSFRIRSEKEIRDYLSSKKALPETIEKIITKLKDHKFLNDEDFAKTWVESRQRVKPRSKFILKMELKQKGIDPEIIEQVLAEDNKEVVSDLEMAKKLVEKNIRKYRGLGRQEIYQKLGGVLGRKGFNWGVIKKAIDEILNKELE